MHLSHRIRGIGLMTAVICWLSMVSDGWAREYVVAVSKSTSQQAEWLTVVEALVQKHQADVVVYDQDVMSCQSALQQKFPRYTCFISPHAEVTREFVADVHQLTRSLDKDPYIDTQWGILTGYDAANALQIAKHAKPLVVRKVGSGTEIALQCCEEGLWYDELVKNKFVKKERGSTALQLQGPDDTTQALVNTLNDYQPDLFITSGHATEADWMIGFRYKNGFFRSDAGQMYGWDTQNRRIEIDSPNPKVYLPIGNCLMGHINGPDAMALAWMNDVGVKQMIGYTVPTWYGYGGWGVLDYFVEQPGRYTLNEAFVANHHALTHLLQQSTPREGDRRGLSHDRDVVAFYGDPAWDARMAVGQLAYDQSLTHADGLYTFTIDPQQGSESFATVNNNGSQRGGRPFIAFFPERLHQVTLVSGENLSPVITDTFILVPRPATCDPDKTYQVQFSAQPLAVKE